MRTIGMLEQDDLILADDWVRPLVFHSAMTQGEIVANSRNTYSGQPVNHPKWVRVRMIFGSCWFGKKVRELDPNQEYEFIRGDVPERHQFDL